jgi:hypothetical protein
LERKHARRGSVEASGSATDVSGSGVGAVSLGEGESCVRRRGVGERGKSRMRWAWDQRREADV